MEIVEITACPKCGDIYIDPPPAKYYKYCDYCQKDGKGDVKLIRRKFRVSLTKGKVVVK